MDFLDKLNHLMDINKLNKHTLSKACEIPYTTIDGWYKKGYEGLKLTTLRKLANYFDTSLDFWVDSTTLQNPKSEKEYELARLFASMNIEGQEQLLEYAKFLATQNKYKKGDTPR